MQETRTGLKHTHDSSKFPNPRHVQYKYSHVERHRHLRETVNRQLL